MADAQEIVRMYRHILKLARHYPSIKRDAIISDIKLEFHENKHLTDPRVIERKVASARQGITELSMYSTMNQTATAWSVDVGREVKPMKPSSPGVKVVGDKK